MALYEVMLRSTYAGQECLNVWNYTSNELVVGDGPAFGLFAAFAGEPTGTPASFPASTVLARLQVMVSNSYQFNSLFVRQIYSSVNFYEGAFVDTFGLQTSGEGLSPTNAFGYRTTRTDLTIRRGTKRFSGVPELASGPLGVIAPAFLPLANALGALMANVLTYDTGLAEWDYVPTIVSKQKTIGPGGSVSYDYYPTLAEQTARSTTGFEYEFYRTIRTQTSRQYGRGR
jgi:hypothetical protein